MASPRLKRRSLAALTVASALMIACTRRIIATSGGNVDGATRPRPAAISASERVIRVAVSTGAAPVRFAGSGDWRLYERDGESLVARGMAGDAWRVEREGDRVRAIRADGVPTVWKQGGLVARSVNEGTGAGLLSVNGRRYRGEVLFLPGDSGVVVVNRVRMDDYLKGVVPLEIGTRAALDSAAVQAQAVTARSYAYIHLGGASPTRPFDVTAGVLDQVYRGADVETPVSTAAVEATRGLVLKYAGRVVNAPYSSTCGGSTAGASEIWRTAGEAYLRSVSDQIPGSDRYYCDIAPRFRWTRTLDGAALRAVLNRYLGIYAAVPGGAPGTAQAVMIDSRTPSGRVATLKVATDRGNYVLRGNDIRYVLRAPDGEILNSTYFSVETAIDRDGSIGKLTLRGSGYGHGVGMCQWGAIGRARAGHDFRAILSAYYPGTTVGAVD